MAHCMSVALSPADLATASWKSTARAISSRMMSPAAVISAVRPGALDTAAPSPTWCRRLGLRQAHDDHPIGDGNQDRHADGRRVAERLGNVAATWDPGCP